MELSPRGWRRVSRLYGEIRIELKVGIEIGNMDFFFGGGREGERAKRDESGVTRRTYYGNEYRSGTISCCPNSRRESSPSERHR